jgi:hypothetical protein
MMSWMKDTVQATQTKNDDDDDDCADDVEDRVHVTPPCALTKSRMRATFGFTRSRGHHNHTVERYLNARYGSAAVSALAGTDTACSIRRVR